MLGDKGVFNKAKRETQGEVKAVFSLLKPMWKLSAGSVSNRKVILARSIPQIQAFFLL